MGVGGGRVGGDDSANLAVWGRCDVRLMLWSHPGGRQYERWGDSDHRGWRPCGRANIVGGGVAGRKKNCESGPSHL